LSALLLLFINRADSLLRDVYWNHLSTGFRVIELKPTAVVETKLSGEQTIYRGPSMTGDPYPTILSPGFGVPLSMFLNFGAPLAANQISRRLKRLKWWPHVVAFFWQIISIFVFAILLLPAVPADEAPSPATTRQNDAGSRELR
jgi:hypothetical protein